MKKKRRKIGGYDSEYLAQSRVVCDCGHMVNFFTNIPYVECTHCHNIIFRDKKAEYDFKVKRRLGVYDEKKKSI